VKLLSDGAFTQLKYFRFIWGEGGENYFDTASLDFNNLIILFSVINNLINSFI